MFCRSAVLRLTINSGATQSTTATRATRPRQRQRQFGGLASSYSRLHTRDDGATSDKNPRASASAFPPMGSSKLVRPLDDRQEASFRHGKAATPDADGFVSQRQRHRWSQSETEVRDEKGGVVAGSAFSPLPKKYGFYDGLDAHAVEAPVPSRELRREQLRRALERSAASVVELTDEAEADIDLGGLPESEYHGQTGWTTVSTQSSLYNNILARDALESRQRSNTWSTARRRGQTAKQDTAHLAPAAPSTDSSSQDGVVLDGQRRRHRQDDGQYNDLIEGELLTPVPESVGQPRSVYALRKMFVQGLVGYQGIISRAEESAIAEELLHLLQSPRAAYVAEESRYCVNLYERELGIPGKDTLAFAMSHAPTLQAVLERFFLLDIIPSIPNVCQVSEMTGNFSGYPVHRKPSSIGSYFGILNLVSTSVLYMQHVDCPWYPRVHMSPRSLFVFADPCLSEYKTGYKWTHQPFHTFDYATRVSKDYRIEVMFATVEVEHQKHLHESIQLTDYATKQLASTSPSSSSTSERSSIQDETTASRDEWLTRLRERLHALEKKPPATDDEMDVDALPLDGNELRAALEARHVVGRTPQRFELHTTPSRTEDAGRETTEASSSPSSSPSSPTMSAAQRRLGALKARHAEAEKRQHAHAQGHVTGHNEQGPRLIRGHAPRDAAGKL